MASGLPYAIGAQAAFPGRQVIAFVGDGGLTLRSPDPALCEAIVDPFEPILPGTLKPEQAEPYAQALASGTPNAQRIGLTLFRDVGEQSPEDVQPLEKAFAEKAPGFPVSAQAPEQGVLERKLGQ